MKPQLVLVLTPFLVALVGCTQPAMGLRPKFPPGGVTTAMQVRDARTPQPSFYSTGYGQVISADRSNPPHPLQCKVLGNMANVVLYLDGPRTVADAIATIVATKYPKSTVIITDCRMVATGGIWMNGAEVFISVRIEEGGCQMTINASGKNAWTRVIEENYERAYERALEELARQIAAAPADLSRAVN